MLMATTNLSNWKDCWATKKIDPLTAFCLGNYMPHYHFDKLILLASKNVNASPYTMD